LEAVFVQHSELGERPSVVDFFPEHVDVQEILVIFIKSSLELLFLNAMYRLIIDILRNHVLSVLETVLMVNLLILLSSVIYI
jgi:hypothetical protein